MSQSQDEHLFPSPPPPTRNPLKRLYNWVLGWADHRFGGWALFFLAMMEASFFPIPPDVLLIGLSLGKPKKAWIYAAVCSVGSVLGGIAGYYIGYALWESLHDVFIPYLFSEMNFTKVGDMYNDNIFLTVFGAAFTPIPFKVFTIAAGVWKVDLFMFILAATLGRSLRFFAEGITFYFFGKQAKAFIDRYFNWVAIGFFILLIAGFVVLKLIIK